MAKTAAERQKAYRQRRAQEAGELRINTWVSAAALKALNALAEQQGMTQKVLLEQIILAAASQAAKPAQPVSRKAASAPTPAQPQSAATAKRKTRTTPTKSTQPAASTASGKPAKAAVPSKAAKATKPARPTARPKAPVQASLWDEF